MEKIIACCGINCANCDARIATVTDDNALRSRTAEKWKVAFNPDITAEMINCTGCRETGVKFAHCSECEIRNCMNTKGFETCADCEKLENCTLLVNIHKHLPEALANLKALN